MNSKQIDFSLDNKGDINFTEEDNFCVKDNLNNNQTNYIKSRPYSNKIKYSQKKNYKDEFSPLNLISQEFNNEGKGNFYFDTSDIFQSNSNKISNPLYDPKRFKGFGNQNIIRRKSNNSNNDPNLFFGDKQSGLINFGHKNNYSNHNILNSIFKNKYPNFQTFASKLNSQTPYHHSEREPTFIPKDVLSFNGRRKNIVRPIYNLIQENTNNPSNYSLRENVLERKEENNKGLVRCDRCSQAYRNKYKINKAVNDIPNILDDKNQIKIQEIEIPFGSSRRRIRFPRKYSFSRFHNIKDCENDSKDDYSNKIFKKTLRNKSLNENKKLSVGTKIIDSDRNVNNKHNIYFRENKNIHKDKKAKINLDNEPEKPDMILYDETLNKSNYNNNNEIYNNAKTDKLALNAMANNSSLPIKETNIYKPQKEENKFNSTSINPNRLENINNINELSNKKLNSLKDRRNSNKVEYNKFHDKLMDDGKYPKYSPNKAIAFRNKFNQNPNNLIKKRIYSKGNQNSNNFYKGRINDNINKEIQKNPINKNKNEFAHSDIVNIFGEYNNKGDITFRQQNRMQNNAISEFSKFSKNQTNKLDSININNSQDNDNSTSIQIPTNIQINNSDKYNKEKNLSENEASLLDENNNKTNMNKVEDKNQTQIDNSSIQENQEETKQIEENNNSAEENQSSSFIKEIDPTFETSDQKEIDNSEIYKPNYVLNKNENKNSKNDVQNTVKPLNILSSRKAKIVQEVVPNVRDDWIQDQEFQNSKPENSNLYISNFPHSNLNPNMNQVTNKIIENQSKLANDLERLKLIIQNSPEIVHETDLKNNYFTSPDSNHFSNRINATSESQFYVKEGDSNKPYFPFIYSEKRLEKGKIYQQNYDEFIPNRNLAGKIINNSMEDYDL